MCFKRDGSEPIPGCRGEGISNQDYCYDPIFTNSPTPLVRLILDACIYVVQV